MLYLLRSSASDQLSVIIVAIQKLLVVQSVYMVINIQSYRIIFSVFYVLYIYYPVYYNTRLPFGNALMYLRCYGLYILLGNALVKICANFAPELRVYYPLTGYPGEYLVKAILYSLHVY